MISPKTSHKEQETQTKNYYNSIAKGYKELYHEEQTKKIRKSQHLIKELIPQIPKTNSKKCENQIILDLGSGDGVLNETLNNLIKTTSKNTDLISLDLSLNLLKLNNNKNNRKINASILKLPIKNESINTIISFSVFQDLPNIKEGITETSRILKKNGKILISIIKNSSKLQELELELKEKFEILEKIEEEKDLIFICKKR